MTSLMSINTTYVHCRKIYNLFARALESGKKASLWRAFITCFAECKLILFLLIFNLLLPFLSVAQQESGTRKAIFWPVTVYSKKISSQCNLTAQIEPVHDKASYAIL